MEETEISYDFISEGKYVLCNGTCFATAESEQAAKMLAQALSYQTGYDGELIDYINNRPLS